MGQDDRARPAAQAASFRIDYNGVRHRERHVRRGRPASRIVFDLGLGGARRRRRRQAEHRPRSTSARRRGTIVLSSAALGSPARGGWTAHATAGISSDPQDSRTAGSTATAAAARRARPPAAAARGTIRRSSRSDADGIRERRHDLFRPPSPSSGWIRVRIRSPSCRPRRPRPASRSTSNGRRSRYFVSPPLHPLPVAGGVGDARTPVRGRGDVRPRPSRLGRHTV